MAKNFEIILNIDHPTETEKGKLTVDLVKEILADKNCRWIIAKHPIDDKSSFNHYHVGIHTESNNEYATIGKWFGLGANSVQKIQKKFDSTYALYLAHYNQDGKSDIPYEDIESNFGLDYNKLVKFIEDKQSDEDVLNALARGDINEFHLYSTMSEEWCRKHLKQINDALVVRSKKFMVSQKERNMEVVYITGEARTGKSYLARRMAKENGHSLYETSNGQNPFDDYMGQDAVLLDDIRPSSFRFSELLKILDNHMSSKVSARYHNIDLNCKVMYLTSVLPLDRFYENIQESQGEATQQLRGRINTLYIVTKDTLTVKSYNPVTNSYEAWAEFPNPILADKNIDLLSPDKRKEIALGMLKGIVDFSNNLMEKVKETDFVQMPNGEKLPWNE